MITKSSRARLKAFSLADLAKECLTLLAYSAVAAAAIAIVMAIIWVTDEVVQ